MKFNFNLNKLKQALPGSSPESAEEEDAVAERPHGLQLPPELIIVILEYDLPSYEDTQKLQDFESRCKLLSNYSLISRHWTAWAQALLFTHVYTYEDVRMHKLWRTLCERPDLAAGVKSLQAWAPGGKLHKVLQQFCEKCKGLEILYIRGATNLTPWFFQGAENLQKLFLMNCIVHCERPLFLFSDLPSPTRWSQPMPILPKVRNITFVDTNLSGSLSTVFFHPRTFPALHYIRTSNVKLSVHGKLIQDLFPYFSRQLRYHAGDIVLTPLEIYTSLRALRVPLNGDAYVLNYYPPAPDSPPIHLYLDLDGHQIGHISEVVDGMKLCILLLENWLHQKVKVKRVSGPMNAESYMKEEVDRMKALCEKYKVEFEQRTQVNYVVFGEFCEKLEEEAVRVDSS